MVYIYSKSNPSKIGTNPAHKNTFYFYASVKNRTTIFHIVLRFFQNQKS